MKRGLIYHVFVYMMCVSSFIRCSSDKERINNSELVEAILDVDNDGIPDSIDNCLTAANFNQLDNDNDGRGNVCDDDDDNDGVLDNNDNCVFFSNIEQLDDDGDGFGDFCDEDGDSPDEDNDGIINANDNCFLIANIDQLDTDSDGEGNL